VAVYIGIIVCLKGIRKAGDSFGNRSIPEYLGDRFESDTLRVLVAIFSMLLLFYLAGQLLAGAVMFNEMMGVDVMTALLLTSTIIILYLLMGGAHADILTDGVQGALMLLLAVFVGYMFLTGFGVVGGYSGMVETLEALDPDLVKTLHPTHPVLNSWWDVFAVFVAHAPLGLLPHIGNKLWALKGNRDQVKFVIFAFAFGMILPCLALGGLVARAVLGDSLLAEGASANYAIPALFIATLPAWLAALIGAGVLAAIMSTADGLVLSTSQIFANDIYRRTIVPRLKVQPSDEDVDSMALKLSRIAMALVMVGSVWLAWEFQGMNVALLIVSGVGGMLGAICGPIYAGILWRGATKEGAIFGFLAGGIVFIVLKAQLLPSIWFESTLVEVPAMWLLSQHSNAFSCSTIGALSSVTGVVIVSLFTQRPSDKHLARLFGEQT
jgi:Na+/proline symporter